MINLSSLLGGGMLLKQQLITESGNWVRPAKMAGNTVWLTMIGGGQSGNVGTNTASRGGNGGEYKIQVAVDIGGSGTVLCTIGEGGAATTSTTQNNGNPTSFGAFLTCLGGSSTTANGRGAPGGQGTVSGTTVSQQLNGSDTPLGYGGRSINIAYGNGGGGLNLGTNPPITLANSGQGSQGYGAGGNGGGSYSYTPGNPGAILVEWPEFV